jgi:phosphatidylinositol alpha-1,6-mannosyltransferase
VTCVLPTDVRLFRDGDGVLRATHSAGRYEQWLPYVGIFSTVVVLARISSEDGTDCGPAEGPNVTVRELPDFKGYRQFFRCLPRVARQIWRLPLDNRLPVVRLPEPLSVLLGIRCRLARRPYGALVVAEIVSATRAYSAHPTRKAVQLLGEVLGKLIGWLVMGASGTIYVTETQLQLRYPAAPGVPVIVRSNVVLKSSEISSKRVFPMHSRKLVAVGTQQTTIKGHDTAIKALQILRSRDDRFKLVLVGAGQQQDHLRRLADEAGVADHVVFTGLLRTPAEVRDVLKSADLFMMPSRSEGLPRALIEAFATGLPAVGSAVGGITELIPAEYLVQPGDAAALAETVARIFKSPAAWEGLSHHSVSVARRIEETLRPERLQEFFERVVANAEDLRLRPGTS